MSCLPGSISWVSGWDIRRCVLLILFVGLFIILLVLVCGSRCVLGLVVAFPALSCLFPFALSHLCSLALDGGYSLGLSSLNKLRFPPGRLRLFCQLTGFRFGGFGVLDWPHQRVWFWGGLLVPGPLHVATLCVGRSCFCCLFHLASVGCVFLAFQPPLNHARVGDADGKVQCNEFLCLCRCGDLSVVGVPPVVCAGFPVGHRAHPVVIPRYGFALLYESLLPGVNGGRLHLAWFVLSCLALSVGPSFLSALLRLITLLGVVCIERSNPQLG